MTSIEGKSIHSREDFIVFLRALVKDFTDNPQSWQNDDLPSFLAAMGAWIEDMDGYYLNQKQPIPSQLDWNILADIFMAAKMYE